MWNRLESFLPFVKYFILCTILLVKLTPKKRNVTNYFYNNHCVRVINTGKPSQKADLKKCLQMTKMMTSLFFYLSVAFSEGNLYLITYIFNYLLNCRHKILPPPPRKRIPHSLLNLLKPLGPMLWTFLGS